MEAKQKLIKLESMTGALGATDLSLRYFECVINVIPTYYIGIPTKLQEVGSTYPML